MESTKIVFPQKYVAYIILKRTFSSVSDLDELKMCTINAYTHAEECKTKFYFVFNTIHVTFAHPFLLKDFAVWMGSQREKTIKYLIHSYIIMSGTFTSMAFDTICSIMNPTKPYYRMKTSDETNTHLLEHSRKCDFSL